MKRRSIYLYSIGEISKMVKISSDTLRYYDEIRLLNPDYINPSNNYRFYNEDQVKELLYIMELKDCGFNLDEIKKIVKLSDEAEIKKLFKKKNFELLKQRKKINSSSEKITNKLKTMKDMEEKDLNKKILIIDDAAFMRMMVHDILKKNGYEVIEAADGIEGIEKFTEHTPALILMDITMGKMDGLTATREIKRIDDGAKIIMLSAVSTPGSIAGSFISGAVDFIAKPFQADRLLETVKKHLEEDVKRDIDIIRNWWQNECKQLPDIPVKNLTDEESGLLSEKLCAFLRENVDLPEGSYPVNYNHMDLTAVLINKIKEYLNPAIEKQNQKISQPEIDTLLAKAAIA